MPSTDGRYERKEGVLSMESTFVQHFMYALDRLQETWNSPEGFSKEKFNMQLLYLVRLLPDKPKQKEILSQWSSAKSDIDKIFPSLSESDRQAYAGMEIVTELIIFICDAFDLVHTDIPGPATAKQFEAEATEMPSDFAPVIEQ